MNRDSFDKNGILGLGCLGHVRNGFDIDRLLKRLNKGQASSHFLSWALTISNTRYV